MRHMLGLSLLVLVLLAGCKEEPPPPPENVPPPPKTVQEIQSDYKASLAPLFAAAAPDAPDLGMDLKNPILSEFQTKRAQYRTEINEPEALGNVESEVSNVITQARDGEKWYALDGLLDLHKSLNPESQRYQSLRQRTDLMLARPWVKVTGFATIDAGDLVTFMTVTDPKTLKSESLTVREGEEFFPDAEGKSVLRLVKVIGAQSAVELEYLKLPGETWEIPGPENN